MGQMILPQIQSMQQQMNDNIMPMNLNNDIVPNNNMSNDQNSNINQNNNQNISDDILYFKNNLSNERKNEIWGTVTNWLSNLGKPIDNTNNNSSNIT
jgi:hypothetical protein